MRRVSSALLISLALAAPAAAQQKEPIGPFVVDLRGAYGRHKTEPSVATELGVEPGNLPSRTFGIVAGAHVYPLRSSKVSLGIGGNMVWLRGSKTIETTASNGTTSTSPTVRRYFTTISPEISINFGHKNGWSYVSGGFFGQSKLYLDRADMPAGSMPYRSTVNYGGGARWFNLQHVAFSVDFRWYSVKNQPATAGMIAQPGTTLLVLSGGVSFK